MKSPHLHLGNARITRRVSEYNHNSQCSLV